MPFVTSTEQIRIRQAFQSRYNIGFARGSRLGIRSGKFDDRT